VTNPDAWCSYGTSARAAVSRSGVRPLGRRALLGGDRVSRRGLRRRPRGSLRGLRRGRRLAVGLVAIRCGWCRALPNRILERSIAWVR